MPESFASGQWGRSKLQQIDDSPLSERRPEEIKNSLCAKLARIQTSCCRTHFLVHTSLRFRIPKGTRLGKFLVYFPCFLLQLSMDEAFNREQEQELIGGSSSITNESNKPSSLR